MTATRARLEELRMLPGPSQDRDVPPERTCAIMEAQLEALAHDIRTVRRGPPPRPRRRRRTGPPDGEPVRLSDRDRIVIRPVRPTDTSALRGLFARLGALTRYRRFLAPIEHLTAHQLTFLTHVDHVDHEALVAFDASTGEAVGVARYRRSPATPREARLAVVVADAWQGRGVATALVERLSARARACRVEVFRGVTAGDNPAAQALLRHAARTLAAEWNMGFTELSVTIDEPQPLPRPALAPLPAPAQ
jgi:RimJ/RimL family protein N-acetyltransferase